MRKTDCNIDLKINIVCPHCYKQLIYTVDDFLKMPLDDNNNRPFDSILRGIVRVYLYGEYNTSEITMTCKDCGHKFLVNYIND